MVRAAGFEPASLPSERTSASQIASQKSALPPELQKVVDAWPDLEPALRAAILAIVNAAGK
jgi:hypothetical protein